jgi:hypothetical protein
MMARTWATGFLALGAASVTALAGASGTIAADRRSHAPAPGYVVAESQYGHGRVSGPVRQTPLGYQVRLPGGTWIYCRMSCTETLRVETVDFWESRGRDGSDRAFGLLDYWRGFPF